MLWWQFANFIMSFLEAQVRFPSNFVSILNAIKHNSSVLLSSNIIYFGQKQPLKVQIIEIFQCSGENMPNSSCHFSNRKTVFLQVLHDFLVSWTITPLYFFRSKVIYFAQKGSIKVQILETERDPNTEKRSKHWRKAEFLCLKNDMRNLVNFNPSSRKSENLNFDGLLL